MAIETKGIVKRFGRFTALRGVDLEVPSGALVALLGPSGSGKTTLLRIIAGLEFADEGVILFDREDARGRHIRERKVGFVFQHYALFRHMTVFENVAFGLRVKPRRERPSERQIRRQVLRLLELVQIERLARRYPSQLSGGQRQRVALARALAIEPKVLLLDEPFGALDAKVRKDLRRWLRRLHDDMGLTSIFVTHDQEEALELSDQVVVMNDGRIEQIGSPEGVYDHPATPFVYEFLGRVNRFDCHVVAGRAELCGASFRPVSPGSTADGPATAYVRPHDIELFRAGEVDGVAAVVRHIATAGPVTAVELVVEGCRRPIEAELTRAHYHALGLRVGQPVAIRIRDARVFAQQASRDTDAAEQD